MQRFFLSAIGFAFLSIALSSCCTPCKERAAQRKAAAESAYGAGTPGQLPDLETETNPLLERDPAQN